MNRHLTLHGVDVILAPMASATTSVRLLCGSGSLSDTRPGAAHFLEHLFFKGTKVMSAGEVNQMLARMGTSNAWTSHDRTCFSIDTLPHKAIDAVALLLHLIGAPRLSQEDIDTERGPILEEWRACQDQGFHAAFDECLERVAGMAPILGTEQSIKDMHRDDLVAYCRQNYRRGNLALVITGNLDHVDVSVLDLFLLKVDIPHGYALEADTPLLLLGRQEMQHSSEQAIVMVTVPAPKATDYAETGYAFAVLDCALGGGMHSLIWKHLREDTGLCYSAGSFHSATSNSFQDLLVVYAMVSPKNAAAARETILHVLRNAEEMLDDEIIETAEAHYAFSVAKHAQTPAGVAGSFFTNWFKDPDIRGYDGFLADFEKGKEARKEQIRAAAKTLLEGGYNVTTLNAEEG